MKYNNDADKTSFGDALLLGPQLGISALDGLNTFLATHPVPLGIRDGLNIVFGYPTSLGGPTRIDRGLDRVISYMTET